MEMLLMVAAISVLGIVVTLGLFAAATGGSSEAEEAASERAVVALPRLHVAAAAAASAPATFFIEPAAGKARQPVPIEVLLLQIEQHVRLEQAAAESFLHAPTVRALHTRTTSPLLH